VVGPCWNALNVTSSCSRSGRVLVISASGERCWTSSADRYARRRRGRRPESSSGQRIEADRHITTIAEIRETVQRTAAGDICLGLLLLIPTATANSST
jgi:hypothetical protein